MNALSKFVCAIALSLPLSAALLAPKAASGETEADDDMTLIAPVAPVDRDQLIDVTASEAQRAAWEKELRATRAQQIARLKEYAARGEFAMNTGGRGLAFVWRDESGKLCAMAHLVNASGRTDLVDRVAKEDNDLQLASVTDGDLYEWMLHSGLTQEEVQLIQRPGFQTELENAPEQAWEVASKRQHLASAVERLEMSTDRSVAIAVDRLAAHVAAATDAAAEPPAPSDSMPGW